MVELIFVVGIVGLLALLVIGPTIYGLILAFKASFISSLVIGDMGDSLVLNLYDHDA